jgi:hypothetical protein
MDIEGSKDIIKQDNFCSRVDGARERNTGFLTTTKCQTLLTDFGLIPSVEELQVGFQSTLVENLFVPGLIVLGMEDNIILSI